MDDVTVDLTPDGLKLTMTEADALMLATAILEDTHCMLALQWNGEKWTARLVRPPAQSPAFVSEIEWAPEPPPSIPLRVMSRLGSQLYRGDPAEVAAITLFLLIALTLLFFS